MVKRTNLVNLDAMIKRADFATQEGDEAIFENVSTISLREFTKGGFIGPNLRKPDFQRETNHWTPEQIVSLLECFINGDLIPSVILWQSPTYLFVIDGGHRLSALKAWVEDDYGDGPRSREFFNNQISDEQKKAAEKTRKLVDSSIGSWQHFQLKIEDPEIGAPERRRVNAVITRGLPIQWVKGDADKAESSFFKINTKGTPLDDIEELLLKNRKKPIPIAARAVIRAGTGHRYWSEFDDTQVIKIEALSKELHQVLFEPEIKRPIKTLDLPLGGSQGVRTALQVLLDFMLIASQNQNGEPRKIEKQENDLNGDLTIECLERALKLAKRITGNDKGSLGLHPAVYFYGPTGRHSGPLFMGTALLIGRKLACNDKNFFKKFSMIRATLEKYLIEHKDLIATILQKHSSKKRVEQYYEILEKMISIIDRAGSITDDRLIEISGLKGKLVVGSKQTNARGFSPEVKSQVFISKALDSALKCPICSGYLDPDKSISYDHIQRKREKGSSDSENCQLTHPYCNQSIKN